MIRLPNSCPLKYPSWFKIDSKFLLEMEIHFFISLRTKILNYLITGCTSTDWFKLVSMIETNFGNHINESNKFNLFIIKNNISIISLKFHLIGRAIMSYDKEDFSLSLPFISSLCKTVLH